MKKHHIFLAAAACFLAGSFDIYSAPQQKNPTVVDIANSVTDESIIYPESFEVDTQKMLEGWYLSNYTSARSSDFKSTDPDVSDAEIIRRLQAIPAVVELPFNQVVRNYIDRYTKKGRQQVSMLLGLSLYYMPIFEQALEQEGLPLELKYLPVIESALDPNAVSKHGATGLWQFMLGAAKGLGMEVNSLVDERRDPYVSSEKAAAFLKDLYATYGDWSLAIAAYNCGPGAVNKAIRRAGGDPKSHNFWTIYNYLSPETRGYVPAFIAATYVMNYYPEHRISPVLNTKPLVTDTVTVSYPVHFEQISKVLSIPMDELRVLNPQFRADRIPASPERPYSIILPSQQVHAFIVSESDIRGCDQELYARLETAEPGAVPDGPVPPESEDGFIDNSAEELLAVQQQAAQAETRQDQPAAAAADPAPASKAAPSVTVMHKVAAGETLATIAEKYSVGIADIKSWNSLRRNAVRTGQQLRIQVPEFSQYARNATKPAKASDASRATAQKSGNNAAATKKQSAKKQTAKAKNTTHTLKSGETLSSLSKKYGVSVDAIKKANGMTSDKLRAGSSITIPAKGGTAAKSSSKSTSKSKKKSRKRR